MSFNPIPVSQIRVPLPVKVMLSYLLVVACLFLPSMYYLGSVLDTQIRDAAASDLRGETDALARILEQAPEEALDATIQVVLAARAGRMILVKPTGAVQGTMSGWSAQGSAALERPIIRQALAEKDRVIVAPDPTQRGAVSVARRVDRSGQVLGVICIGSSAGALHKLIEDAKSSLNYITAIALSVSVALSLLASLVIVRPLNEITETVRLFSAGDLSRPIDTSSNDELGDAAVALRDLGNHLRTVLISSGAHRATLRALTDNLPLGVVLFDQNLEPDVVGGHTRELCDLTTGDEHALVKQISELDGVRQARDRTLEQLVATVTSFRLPWKIERALEARWIPLYEESGAPRLALVLSDRNKEENLAELSSALRGTSELLRRAAQEAGPESLSGLKISFEKEADQLESMIPQKGPNLAQEIVAVDLAELCGLAADELHARAQVKKVQIKLDLPEETTPVAEVDGRCRQAVRRFLELGLLNSKKGSKVILHAEVLSAHARLTMRIKNRIEDISEIDAPVRPLGGKAGAKKFGEHTIVLLDLPRA